MSHPDDGMLAALLDGELTGDEQRTLEAHLRECEVCRARLAEEQAMMAESDGMVESLVPPPLGQVLARPVPRAWWVRYRPLAWAATVVLAAGIGYYSGEWRGRPDRALPPAPTEASGPARQNAPDIQMAPGPVTQTVPSAEGNATANTPESPPAGKAAVPEKPAAVKDQDEAGGHRDDLAQLHPGVTGEPGTEERPGAPAPIDSGRAAAAAAPLIPADQVATKQRADAFVAAPAGSEARARRDASAESAQKPEAAQRLAVPSKGLGLPGNGFRPSSLEDAVDVLGGSILLIDGLSPDGVELNSEVPPVARIRYTFPTQTDTLYLEQRRANISGATSYGARNNNLVNILPGYSTPMDSLKFVRNGLVFRLSGTVGDSVLETLVPRIH